MNKQVAYGYDDALLTHQPRVVCDDIMSQSYDLYWDANGNLAQVLDCNGMNARFHVWDDNNRLLSVIGPKQAGFYGYNGNGERVWKLTGMCNLESQNGGNIGYSVALDDAVLYPNPYITITPQGYAKHFYVGSERIATALGEGGWYYAVRSMSDNEIQLIKAYFNHFFKLPCEKYSQTKNENISHVWLGKLQYSCNPECLEQTTISASHDLLLTCISTYQQPSGHYEDLYFTHSDHLGSASWITDGTGVPIQYIHYAPYGELLANQQATGSTYDERYKFTGKERDAETGYDYFGARFLAQQLGIWLSVDPLVDKYLGISPYAYCAWNPIKYLDPDGRKVGIKGVYNNEDGTTSVETFYYDEVDGVRGFYHNGQRLDNELANQATEAIGKIQDGGKYGKMLVDGVVKDDRTIYLCPTKDFTQNQSICDLGKLQWMANDYSFGDMTIPSFITLTHEFAHFISSWYGFADHGVWFRNDGRKVYNDEKWVVNIENLIRNENHLEPRQYYIIPSSPGGSGMGKIPQWGWAKDVLEIVCKF